MDNTSKLFDDIVRLSQQYKLPGLELDTILQGRRKDLEALLEAGKIAQAGGQSIAQKQAEILRTALEDLRSVLSAQTGTDQAKINAVGHAAQRAFGNVGELTQIALQSQAAAFDTLRARTEESLAELRALAPTSGSRSGWAPK